MRPDPVAALMLGLSALAVCALAVAPTAAAMPQGPDPGAVPPAGETDVPPPRLTPAEVPAPLRPWVPWVLAEHPSLPCPRVAGEHLCAWPGSLRLDLAAAGGRFALDVVADRDLDLPLPGGPALWPVEVTDNGRPALLRRSDDTPAVALTPGRHHLAGIFRWSRLPEALPVPPAVAIVSLAVGGREVTWPERESDGLLRLTGPRDKEGADRIEVSVARRIEDGVPVALVTRLRLRVSGQPRETALGAPLPEGFVAVELEGAVPVRLDPNGGLVAQVRPGDWTITLRALSTGPIEAVDAVGRPAPWPGEETWVFAADPAVRSVRIAGGQPVDPRRTELPEAWWRLPAFRLRAGDSLELTTVARGREPAPPDAVVVRRTLRLALDGSGYAVDDRLSGSLEQGGRLEPVPPATLGRLEEKGEARVITLAPESGAPGIEVRQRNIELDAELVYPRGGTLPAVGWNRDAEDLSATLYLPPGWTLVAAPGADTATGAWLDAWTVLDLFLLLLIALAVARLDSWRWGVLTLALLALSWQGPHGTGLWAWLLALMALRAIDRSLEAGGRTARTVHVLRWAVSLGFAVQLVVFGYGQWRSGLFPHLEGVERPTRAQLRDLATSGLSSPEPPKTLGDPDRNSLFEVEQWRYRRSQASDELARLPEQENRGEAERRDEVAQTGPGNPSWSWNSVSLHWNGPVKADQRLRLLLVSPSVERLLSLFRLAAAVLLGLIVLDRRRDHRGAGPPADAGPAAGATATALALALALGVTTPAVAAPLPQSAPPADLLAELARRLTAPPPCEPDCVEVSRLRILADDTGLRMEAEVHAAAASAWPLPGPSRTWAPIRVTVDGEETAALRRRDDGFLWLRLAPGTHRVRFAGPAADSLTLELPLAPRSLDWQGDGWSLTGYRPDAAPPSALRLDRDLDAGSTPGGPGAGAALAPWLVVTRDLHIGISWEIDTEVRRLGTPAVSLPVGVPLLSGESVTSAGVLVEGGEAQVTLERGETVRRWRSTLAPAGELTLTAASGRPWLERWVLDCTALWHCAAEGLAPTRLQEEDRWRPLWQPWPGERLTLRFAKPEVAPGSTAVADGVRLHLTPGRRVVQAELRLLLRSGGGGEHTITLPAEAELSALTIDGRQRPARLDAGHLAFSVEPGAHQVEVGWQVPRRLGLLERAAAVTLDTPAVDVRVTMWAPENRWLLWAGGPAWGPVVLMWQYLLVLALVGWALGRWAPTPLSGLDWFLLGAGMTQAPLAASVTVAAWLVLLGLRPGMRPRRWWSYDLLLIGFALLGLTALAMLYWGVHAGLLFQPDLQVIGGGSLMQGLSWYTDRIDGALPRPWVLWLPLWVWRGAMLAWALWLAARLLRWLPWAWRRSELDRPLLLWRDEVPAPVAPADAGGGDS